MYGTQILKVISGSIAYNCNLPESDVDELGIFVAPMEDILSFGSKQTSSVIQHGKNDETWWELGKACSLLMKGNFNALPLLLSAYVVDRQESGRLLRSNRDVFLSKKCVKSLLGYTGGELRKYLSTGKTKNPDAKKSIATVFRQQIIAKRLMQGNFSLALDLDERRTYLALRNGELDVRSYAQLFFEYGQTNLNGMLKVESELPEEPDTEKIKEIMIRIRQEV